MNLQTFELAVEAAALEERPLWEILGEFWEDSQNLEASGHMAEALRGRPIEEVGTFSAQFLVERLRELGVEIRTSDLGDE